MFLLYCSAKRSSLTRFRVFRSLNILTLKLFSLVRFSVAALDKKVPFQIFPRKEAENFVKEKFRPLTFRSAKERRNECHEQKVLNCCNRVSFLLRC